MSQATKAVTKATLAKPFDEPGKIIHATVAPVEEYVAPPVVNLQAQFESRRRPLPSEEPAYIAAESEARQRTVEDLKDQIAVDVRLGKAGPAEGVEESARAATVERMIAEMRREKSQPEARETVALREAAAHQVSLDFIMQEMRQSVHTENYSGGGQE